MNCPGVIPAHVDHWVLIGLLETRVLPGKLRVLVEEHGLLIPAECSPPVLLGLGLVTGLVHKKAKLTAGHSRDTQIKWPRDPDLVLRMLVGFAFPVARAHEERAGWNPLELDLPEPGR